MTPLELGPTVYIPGGGFGMGRINSGLPFVGNIGSPYGPRTVTPALAAAGATSPWHGAVDVQPDGGSPGVGFAAPAPGIVDRADDVTEPGEWYKGFWLQVRSLEDPDYRWGAYHLAEPARDYETGEDLKVGDYVRRGQIVGTVGTTGASTGIHAHFYVQHRIEVLGIEAWEDVEPTQFFTQRPTATPNVLPALTRAELGAALVDEAGVHAMAITRDGMAIGNAETYRVNLSRDEATGQPV